MCFLLQLQSLDEMAERGEARGHEGGGGGGGTGDADALEDGSLTVLRDSVVFDARLEGVEEGQAGLDIRRRLLEGLEQVRRLFLHGGHEKGPLVGGGPAMVEAGVVCVVSVVYGPHGAAVVAFALRQSLSNPCAFLMHATLAPRVPLPPEPIHPWNLRDKLVIGLSGLTCIATCPATDLPGQGQKRPMPSRAFHLAGLPRQTEKTTTPSIHV